MVLLKLSKFKLQLQALVTEVRELRERERSAYEQLQLSIQKQKQTEEEFNTKLTGLQAELALSNELGQNLEKKVRYLQSDNAMLENKQKELKGTINSLLRSRDSFLKSYEDSTCEMKRSIESRDRKISVLLEKINAHLLLIGTIEKEASSVKQVVDNVQHALNDKEEVVAGLKSKLDKVSTFEMLFVEKINNLESKLRNDEDELGRKDKIIMELEAQMEAAKFTNKCHPQIEELQKIVSAKDLVIQNLISEKKALQFELGSLGVIVKKIQDTVIQMNEEDRRSFSSMLVGQEECEKNRDEENNRTEDVQNHREKSPHKGSGREATKNTASPLCQECNSISSPLMENNNLDNSCLSEASGLFNLLFADKFCMTQLRVMRPRAANLDFFNDIMAVCLFSSTFSLLGA